MLVHPIEALLTAANRYDFRRKSKVREKVPYDDPAFDYPNGDAVKKSPLYDELSIPFIDASPAPTPKTGRSTERFLNSTPS